MDEPTNKDEEEEEDSRKGAFVNERIRDLFCC
jgi:hypothetical protein